MVEDEYLTGGCIFVTIKYGMEEEIYEVINAIEELYNVKIKKIRIQDTEFSEFISWREFEDRYNKVPPFCQDDQSGGARKKRSMKKRSIKKGKKPSLKKGKKRSIKK